jgi:hypothetical protein
MATEQLSALQNAMIKRMTPQLKKLGNREVVYDKPTLEKMNGKFCYTMKYTLVSKHDIPRVWERRYFYLRRGTFLLTLSYDKAVASERKTELAKILDSFVIE